MRAVVQCVSGASVTVNNELVSKISKGLMVLVGIGTDDTEADIATLSKKMLVSSQLNSIFRTSYPDLDPPDWGPGINALYILSLRVFADPTNPQNMWKASVKDIDGDILCVSQFTLLANTSKGNKPDFHRAMATEPSRALYAKFLESLRKSYKGEKIQDGVFGAMMSVSLTNEGPVTITLDTCKFEYVDTPENSRKSGKKTKAPSETKSAETPILSPTDAP